MTAAFDDPFEPLDVLRRLLALGLLRELDEPLRERDELLREPDAPLRELDALLREPDAPLRELDALLREPDALLRELDVLPRELEDLVPEPDDELFAGLRFEPLPFVALAPLELRLAVLRLVPDRELAWAISPP